MKQFVMILSLVMLLVVGCAGQKAELSLTSSKSIYVVGEPIELQIQIAAKKDGISFADEPFLTDWLEIYSRDPNLALNSAADLMARSIGMQKTFDFPKPLRKWSVLPGLVVEYEVLLYFETDCYGLDQMPLRAPPTQGRQLGRAGSLAEVHAAGGQRRRRALAV